MFDFADGEPGPFLAPAHPGDQRAHHLEDAARLEVLSLDP